MARQAFVAVWFGLMGCGGDSAAVDDPNASRGGIDYYDACVTGCEADRGLSEAECEVACEDGDDGACGADAEAAYGDCLDEGGTEEECSDRAGGLYDDCVGERTETRTGTDPCGAVAEQAWQDCIDAGGSDEDCRTEADDAYNDCVNGTGT